MYNQLTTRRREMLFFASQKDFVNIRQSIDELIKGTTAISLENDKRFYSEEFQRK